MFYTMEIYHSVQTLGSFNILGIIYSGIKFERFGILCQSSSQSGLSIFSPMAISWLAITSLLFLQIEPDSPPGPPGT